MKKISLAFETLNLRWNPFGEPVSDDIVRLAVVDIEPYVEQLRKPGFAIQYRGESGRGKSTHLLALHHFFSDMPYLRFSENAKIPRIPYAPVLFLDETQRLPPSLRRRIFSRKASFAIGSHEDHSNELAGTVAELVSIELKGLTYEHLMQIVQRRIEWARRGPGPLPNVPASRLTQLINEYGDDLSAILASLYEEFQNLEKDGTNEYNRYPGGI